MSESKHSFDEALRLNLSYVLHETSDSQHVRRASRDSQRFRRKRQALLDRLRKLSDSDLVRITGTTPALNQALASPRPVGAILTASVGLPELLGRLLSAKDVLQSGSDSLLMIDQAVHERDSVTASLFAATARLPAMRLSADVENILVAGLIVRPGERSLLLTGEVVEIPGNGSRGDTVYVPSTTGALEHLIRDFVDQWTPERALWDTPAEQVLPELQPEATRERSA